MVILNFCVCDSGNRLTAHAYPVMLEFVENY